jgi:hypothetical protein
VNRGSRSWIRWVALRRKPDSGRSEGEPGRGAERVNEFETVVGKV